MSRQYRIVEMFRGIQGEGHFAGTPAVFIRFAGCNLNCSFCDTPHKGSPNYYLAAEKVAEEVLVLCATQGRDICHVVFTGGEPMMQLDSDLITAIRRTVPGAQLQIETNGEAMCVPVEVSYIESNCWVTWSPKHVCSPWIRPDEVKVLSPTPWGGDPADILPFVSLEAKLLIQPMVGDEGAPRPEVLEDMNRWLEAHPGWRLSIQLHKMFDWR